MIDRRVDDLHGGDPRLRDKLNEVVELINSLKQLKGDETFISVLRGPGGAVVKLNINEILARIPKSVGGGEGDLIPVGLVKQSGGAGGPASSCSFQYNVFPIDGGGETAHNVAPLYRDNAYEVTYHEASFGIASPDGKKLYYAFEAPFTVACDSLGGSFIDGGTY